MTRVLGVFAKQPIAGQVKTRLATLRSPAWAGRVAAAFLEDTLDRLATIAPRRIIVYAPADSTGFFASVAGERYELAAQASGDLGQRLESFFQYAMAAGAEQVVVVGTDSPTLPVEFVHRAFASLDRADVVLGPACDGGYYLLGGARSLPPLFAGVPWSTADVLRETVRRITGPLELLPPWYDVDTPADWSLLCGHVLAMRRSGVDPGIPRTERLVLESLSG
jgi:uncharacterized protein